MQDKHLFEYAVIRVVPRVEREEFINVGIIVFCKQQQFLKTLIETSPKRLLAFASDLDIEELNRHLLSFHKICEGKTDSGPIGQLAIAERFRWLTASRSTILQTSKVHPGFCENANDLLAKLFNELVR